MTEERIAETEEEQKEKEKILIKKILKFAF